MGSVASDRTGPVSSGVSGTFDQFIWYFFRVSGILLVFLAGGHLFITHYLNVPSETTFDFVSERWANPLWRTFDWLLLLLALWHGVLGWRNISIDMVKSPGWKLVNVTLAFAIGLVFTAIGTVTVFTFDEQASANNTGPLSGDLWIADVIGYSLFAFAILMYLGVIVLAIYLIRHISLGTRPVYSGDIGQYAWILHRLSGLGILFFLLVHIIDIMLIGLGRDVYDKSVDFYSKPFLIPMEIALVGAVVYHSLNGLRIILIDFWGQGVAKQRTLYISALVGTVLLTLPAAIVIIQNEF